MATTLKSLADLGGFGCILEPVVYDRTALVARKRPDVEFLTRSGSIFGDVTVQNPVTPSRIRALLPFKTSVAAAASQKKSKYVKWLFDQKVSGSFFPLVMSLFGGFGPDFKAVER